MRRLVMMFALSAFVLGTVLSAGCGEKTEKKADDKKPAVEDKKPADGSGASVTPPAGETALTKVSFEVTGMSWPTGWGAKIKKALAELQGVANIDVTKGSVTCQIPEGVSAEDVAGAIEGIGFGASLKK